MIDIDFTDMATVKRASLYIKAKHISHRIMTTLSDYYDGTGVEPWDEIDLPEMITSEIQSCLNELKGQ